MADDSAKMAKAFLLYLLGAYLFANGGQTVSLRWLAPFRDFRGPWECGHNRESPPSFCNGLGTIYITSSRGRTIDLTTRDMSSELRYSLGNVLGTQNHPTLRLASFHCVLHPNPIKGMFNIVYLTHTRASIHLSTQHGIHHL